MYVVSLPATPPSASVTSRPCRIAALSSAPEMWRRYQPVPFAGQALALALVSGQLTVLHLESSVPGVE